MKMTSKRKEPKQKRFEGFTDLKNTYSAYLFQQKKKAISTIIDRTILGEKNKERIFQEKRLERSFKIGGLPQKTPKYCKKIFRRSPTKKRNRKSKQKINHEFLEFTKLVKCKGIRRPIEYRPIESNWILFSRGESRKEFLDSF